VIALAAVPALALAALVAALWPWTRLFDRRPAVRLLVALTLASAAIVGIELALGIAGALHTRALGAAMGGAIAALAGGALLYRAPLAAFPADPPARPTAIGLTLGVLALAAQAGVAAVCGLVPPWGWDTLQYHLTQIYQIAQTASLQPPAVPTRTLSFPIVGELHGVFWFLLSGAGPESWRLTGIAMMPFALLAGAAARALGLALDLRAGLPWLFPGMLLVPVVLIQPAAGYVDVAAAAFTLAAIAFAALAARSGRYSDLVFCALAAGLAAGVKLSFAVFLPVLLLLVLGRAARARLAWAFAGRVVRGAAGLAAAFFAGCGYWLVRNGIATGNPFHPSRLRLGPFVLFQGPHTLADRSAQESWFVASRWEWLSYPFRESFRGAPAWTVENGFGPLFAGGLVAALLLIGGLSRHPLQRATAWGLVAVLAIFHLASLAEPRYVIAACGLALACLAAAADRIGSGGAAGRWMLRLVHAQVAAVCVITAAGSVASAAPHLDLVARAWRAGEWRPERYYGLEYGSAGEAFNWLSATSPAGTVVAATTATFLAPLYGWAGRNRVVFVRTPDDLPVATPWNARTRDDWRSILLAEHVDRVVVWKSWWDETLLDRPAGWMREQPEGYRLLSDFKLAAIYQPVFTGEERTRLAAAGPSAPDLARLGAAAAWRVEHEEGGTCRVQPVPGGARVTYDLSGPGNDWVDLRADLDGDDWSRFDALVFNLTADPAPAWLFVHLKSPGGGRSARFRVDLDGMDGAPRRIRLDLHQPERKDWLFSLDQIAELHLVLDDSREDVPARGAIAVSGFRLERDPADAVVSSEAR